MIDQVLQLLTSGSPMVAFAIYLIWSNTRSEKRLDEVNNLFMARVDSLVSENKIEIEHLRISHTGREDALRDRWENVVTELQKDRDELERTILRNTESTLKTVDRLAAAIETLGLTLSGLGERVGKTESKMDRLLDRKK